MIQKKGLDESHNLHRRGYVIGIRRFKDSSMIIEWLSEKEGRISTIAQGAFRKNSAFAGRLDLFFLVDLSIRKSRRSELHMLREVALISAPVHLQRSLIGLEIAAYFVDLVKKTTETNTPIPEIFQLFDQAIHAAENGFASSKLLLWFEFRLLLLLGLQPEFQNAKLSKSALSIMCQWKSQSAFPPPPDPFPKSEIATQIGSAIEREVGNCTKLRGKILNQ